MEKCPSSSRSSEPAFASCRCALRHRLLLVCKTAPPRTRLSRLACSRVRNLATLHPSASQNHLPCALVPFSAHWNLLYRGRQQTPTRYGLRPILPSLTAGPLPLTRRGRLRLPGVSYYSASRVLKRSSVHMTDNPDRKRLVDTPFSFQYRCIWNHHHCAPILLTFGQQNGVFC